MAYERTDGTERFNPATGGQAYGIGFLLDELFASLTDSLSRLQARRHDLEINPVLWKTSGFQLKQLLNFLRLRRDPSAEENPKDNLIIVRPGSVIQESFQLPAVNIWRNDFRFVNGRENRSRQAHPSYSRQSNLNQVFSQ